MNYGQVIRGMALELAGPRNETIALTLTWLSATGNVT